MGNTPFKNTVQSIPFKNESKAPFVKLRASIRMLVYLSKTPSPYFEFEDVTNYTDNPDTKIYSLKQSLSNNTLIGSVTKTILDANLNDVIKSTDFPSVNVDNVIEFKIILETGSTVNLDSPYDDFGTQLENQPIGSVQSYKFVITTTDFIRQINDELNASFMSLVQRAVENLVNSSLFLSKKAVDDKTLSNMSLADLFSIVEDGYLLLITKDEASTLNSAINPDIDITNIEPEISSGVMTSVGSDYSGEFGNEIDFNHRIENLFRSPINANTVELQYWNGSSWITLETINVQPASNYWFGFTDETIVLAIQDATGFVYGTLYQVRLLATDEQGNSVTEEFTVDIQYPLNVHIETGALAGEPDNDVVPITTVTDSDGEVIEATYDFKNFIYIKTDRQTLSNINVEYSLDNVAWSNADYSIITVGGWDYVKVLIPYYSFNVYLRIEDQNLSSLSRTLLFYSTWINEESIETKTMDFIVPSEFLDFSGSEIIELTAKIDQSTS